MEIREAKEEQGFLQEVLDRETWNATVERLGGGVFQSWEWGEFRRRHNWKPLRLLDPDGRAAAQVLLRRLPGLGYMAYAPHGPISNDEADLPAAAQAVADHARRRGACLLQIEPRVEEARGFKAEGFVKSESPVQPRCTFALGVLDDPEEQLAAFPKDARYGVRRARREGVEVEVSTDVTGDLEQFLDLHEMTATRQKFALRPRDYYRQFMRHLPAHLLMARRGEDGHLLAGAVIVTFGHEAYYLYGASSAEAENLYASYLVQHEMLNVARQEGVSVYDMGGIPCNPREDDPLWGVYQFKKKFGGEEKHYVGGYEKSLDPLRARLVRAGIRGYYALQRARGKSAGPLGG